MLTKGRTAIEFLLGAGGPATGALMPAAVTLAPEAAVRGRKARNASRATTANDRAPAAIRRRCDLRWTRSQASRSTVGAAAETKAPLTTLGSDNAATSSAAV